MDSNRFRVRQLWHLGNVLQDLRKLRDGLTLRAQVGCRSLVANTNNNSFKLFFLKTRGKFIGTFSYLGFC